MSLKQHAEMELKAINCDEDMAKDVLELIEVFGNQGHSGASAPFCIDLFKKLANYEPLCPLTGKDDEWMEVGPPGVFQNKRCGHVFKDHGIAYDLDGKIWVDEDGTTWTNGDSKVVITFPYTPKSERVNRKAHRDSIHKTTT